MRAFGLTGDALGPLQFKSEATVLMNCVSSSRKRQSRKVCTKKRRATVPFSLRPRAMNVAPLALPLVPTGEIIWTMQDGEEYSSSLCTSSKVLKSHSCGYRHIDVTLKSEFARGTGSLDLAFCTDIHS